MSLPGAGVAVMTAIRHGDHALARDLIYETDAPELAYWFAESYLNWLRHYSHVDVDDILRFNGLRFAEEENAT